MGDTDCVLNICRYELKRLYDRAHLFSREYLNEDIPILLRNHLCNISDELRRLYNFVDSYSKNIEQKEEKEE